MQVNTLLAIINDYLPDGAQAVVHQENDQSFTLAVLDAVIQDGEIVTPQREYVVEGTITAPITFRVTAISEEDADEQAHDALSTIAMRVESEIDTMLLDAPDELRAGIVDYQMDDLTED